MGNHFHLLLKQVKEGGISDFMKKIGGYVSFFNKKHDRKGTLFQGRFRATLIKTEEQLKNTFCYIHTNPVEIIEPEWKNFIVKDRFEAKEFLKDYRWSSYSSFIGQGEFDKIVKKDFFLDIFGGIDGVKEEINNWIEYKAGRFQYEGLADR
jgi:putative transposase